MTSNDSKIQDIHEHFMVLSAIASELNIASDELTKQIAVLDEALKKLNVGLTVWVKFSDHSNPAGEDYDLEQIGYTKLQGKWGISLRHIWGYWGDDDHAGEDGPWLFNDAPRDMRIRSVDKIPDVLRELSKEASNATKKIQEKTKEVHELAAAIGSVKTGERHLTPAERAAAAALTERMAEASKLSTMGTLRDLVGGSTKKGTK